MSEQGNAGGAAGGGEGAGGSGGASNSGGGSGSASGFLGTLAPEYQDAISKTGIADADGLAKAYINAQQALGNSVRIPGQDAGPDDVKKFDAKLAEKVPGLVRLPGEGDADGWKQFYSRLGVPETPNNYAFKAVDGIPEAVGTNLDQWFAPLAHKANLTAAQASVVRAEWLESIKASATAAEAAAGEAEHALRDEWGAGYEQRLARAMGTMAPILGDKAQGLIAEIESRGLGNMPLLAQYMERVADFLGEDKFVPGQRPNLGMPDSLGEINEKIAEIQKNPAYRDNRDPTHKSLVAKMENLYQQRAALQGQAA